MLALTQAESPSVIQVRTQDVTPAHLENAVVDLLRKNESILEAKALIVLDEGRSRVRILPLGSKLLILRYRHTFIMAPQLEDAFLPQVSDVLKAISELNSY